MITKDVFLSDVFNISWFRYNGDINNKDDVIKALNYKDKRIDFTIDAKNLDIFNFLIKKECYLSSSKAIYEYNKKGKIKLESKNVQSAKLNDAEEIAKIAIDSFSLDRYRNDPYLDKSKINKLYNKWIKNNLSGRCIDVLIYKENSKIKGFVCLISKKDNYYIELVATKPDIQNKRVATVLIRTILNKFSDKKKMCITQIHNMPMQRLLQKIGFRLINNQYILTKTKQ